MPQPLSSDEFDEWENDDGYVDLSWVIERLDLSTATTEQPQETDDDQ